MTVVTYYSFTQYTDSRKKLFHYSGLKLVHLIYHQGCAELFEAKVERLAQGDCAVCCPSATAYQFELATNDWGVNLRNDWA